MSLLISDLSLVISSLLKCTIRCVSLKRCIKCLIEQWPALYTYLDQHVDIQLGTIKDWVQDLTRCVTLRYNIFTFVNAMDLTHSSY